MPLEQATNIDRALKNIDAFSNATSFNMTDAPRKRVKALLSHLHNVIRNEPPNTEFLTNILEYEAEYEAKFSEKSFPQYYNNKRNKGFDEFIKKILYLIRLHLHCIELFDHDHQYKKLQQTLHDTLDNFVAPLVCPDIYYYDDFVRAFKASKPSVWFKTNTPVEAQYYTEFAFECSGSFDPQSKTKIYNSKKHHEATKPNQAPIDFLEYLIKSKRFLHVKNHATSARDHIGRYDMGNFSEIVIHSHDPILMDLQYFLWTHYELPVGKTMEAFLQDMNAQAAKTMQYDIVTQAVPRFASKKEQESTYETFTQLTRKLNQQGNDLFAMLKELIKATKESKYTEYYDFTPKINGSVWFIMQFWFYYKTRITIEQMVDLFAMIPKNSKMLPKFGDFLLKIIAESNTTPSAHHLKLARSLITMEENTKSINPKLTPFLRKLLLEYHPANGETPMMNDNHPVNLSRKRNVVLNAYRKPGYKQHLVLNLDLLRETLSKKLATPSIWTRLRYGSANIKHCYSALSSLSSSINNTYENEPLEIQKTSSPLQVKNFINCIAALGHKQRLYSSGTPFHEELLILVLQTIVETKVYKEYKNHILQIILENVPAESPYTNYIIDEMWQRVKDSDSQNNLLASEQLTLLKAILANKAARKKYYTHMDTLYKNVYSLLKSSPLNKAELIHLKAACLEAKSNPPSMLPTMPLWSRIKTSFELFESLKTSLFANTDPKHEAIEDEDLIQFCNKSLEDHQATFYQFEPLGVVDEKELRKRAFYTELRFELTKYLSTQQYLYEMEQHNYECFPQNTYVHIEKIPNIENYEKNQRWMDCIKNFPDSELSEERLERVKGQPYQRASIIADALSAVTATHVETYLAHLVEYDDIHNDNEKVTVKKQISKAVDICLKAFPLPLSKKVTLEDSATIVGNNIAKLIEAEYASTVAKYKSEQPISPAIEIRAIGPSIAAALRRSPTLRRDASRANLTQSAANQNYDPTFYGSRRNSQSPSPEELLIREAMPVENSHSTTGPTRMPATPF